MRKASYDFKIKKVDEPPYIVDREKLKRYDQVNLIFNRVGIDPSFIAYKRNQEKVGLQKIKKSKSGYTRVDYALAEAAWTVHDVWVEGFNWNRLSRPYRPSLMGTKWYQDKYIIDDPKEITRRVKKASEFYGASLVGVTKIDDKWIYANRRRDLESLELPEEVCFAIVMAVEMDAFALATSPMVPAAAATGLGYSKMTFTTACLAEFIRNLGYIAVPTGNDTGLSIPIAIDAGLGQLGRNGLLITPEYGPRVRLMKVFTNLPLIPDKPINFGLTQFCKDCMICAEACEVEAISKNIEPSWKPSCVSNNPGALKWYIDAEKCYEYWCDNGTDCSTCITVCPFNNYPDETESIEFWKD
jgi:ferredoxin